MKPRRVQPPLKVPVWQVGLRMHVERAGELGFGNCSIYDDLATFLQSDEGLGKYYENYINELSVAMDKNPTLVRDVAEVQRYTASVMGHLNAFLYQNLATGSDICKIKWAVLQKAFSEYYDPEINMGHDPPVVPDAFTPFEDLVSIVSKYVSLSPHNFWTYVADFKRYVENGLSRGNPRDIKLVSYEDLFVIMLRRELDFALGARIKKSAEVSLVCEVRQ